MDLKQLLGENFKDGMTFEEMQTALADIEMVDKSALSGLIDKKHFDKAASELADYKRQLKAKMSEDEIKEAERKAEQEARDAELAEYKNKVAVTDAEKRFLALGYDATLASETAQAFVSSDMDTVFKNQAAFVESREKAIKAELLEQMPTPPAGGDGTKTVTKEDYGKMTYMEKLELKQNYPDTYKEIIGG